MWKNFVFFCFLLLNASSDFYGQNYAFKQTWSLNLKGEFLYSDNLGNAFVQLEDQLTKVNANGKLLNVYSNKNLGRITHVDALNPLKIILFYKEFGRLIFLDNTLTENGAPLFLEDHGLELTSLTCASYDNGLWLYDPFRFTLYRFNQMFQQTNTVRNLNQLLGKNIQPVFMVEADNKLFVSDPEEGIFVFDIFGTYLKKIPVNTPGKFQVINEIIYYPEGGNLLKSYHLKTLQYGELNLPTGKLFDFQLDRRRLLILDVEGLHSFDIIDSAGK